MSPDAPPPDAGDDTALVEPARQRLLTIADDVLGRLPADQVPVPLRPVARFTPAKRLRLGAFALAGALDTDDDFRSRVAEAAEAASPELADAVRSGDPLPASDPLDVAVLTFLLRPDGWQQRLAALGRRWREENRSDPDAEAELARVRAEVAELRTQVRGEAARVREAVEAALAEAEAATDAELLSLRRAARDRTRQVREAERDRDAARAEIDGLRAAIAGEAARHEAELAALRSRIAAAEQAADTARQGTRAEREIDDARLWLLVDTLVQAASGVRRELALPEPTARPADAVAVDDPGTGTAPRVVDRPGALDDLMALPHPHLIVDGYNVTKTGYPHLTLAEQRTRLLGALAPLAARVEVTVVFDGAARPAVQPVAPRGVRVLFSAGETPPADPGSGEGGRREIADDVIRRVVAAEPSGRCLLVVTSDRQIVRDTAGPAVWAVPSAVLLERLG
ncbi:NYN domain-containing protein [Jatrophihabitans fulvus]